MYGYYPKSKVETKGFMAVHYDAILDIATFGRYSVRFITATSAILVNALGIL